jgi:hypothetical protein
MSSDFVELHGVDPEELETWEDDTGITSEQMAEINRRLKEIIGDPTSEQTLAVVQSVMLGESDVRFPSGFTINED